MNLFYTTDIAGEWARLHDDEARHCSQVLRMKVGDTVQLADGLGFFYEGSIAEIGKKDCLIHIRQRTAETPRPFRIHIAIAPTKNIERFEWFLEKVTEIGVDDITPLLCERSERRQIRADRLEKILIAAMKQSLKARPPKLHDFTPFDAFIRQAMDGQKFIAYLGEAENPYLKNVCAVEAPATVLIGPEGDFSPKEIEQALQYGFCGVSLGSSRLRTETAGVLACHTVHLLNK